MTRSAPLSAGQLAAAPIHHSLQQQQAGSAMHPITLPHQSSGALMSGMQQQVSQRASAACAQLIACVRASHKRVCCGIAPGRAWHGSCCHEWLGVDCCPRTLPGAGGRHGGGWHACPPAGGSQFGTPRTHAAAADAANGRAGLRAERPHGAAGQTALLVRWSQQRGHQPLPACPAMPPAAWCCCPSRGVKVM